MKAVVTGAAGFIGSHLSERLLAEGIDVVGVDSFSDHYSRGLKERNLRPSREHKQFSFLEADLTEMNLGPLLADVDYVFHLAARAGVRTSWGSTFEAYLRDNVLATQNLLEAAKDSRIKKLVFASSSSIYGDAERFPTPESALPLPISPYGVSKLAAESLCRLYWRRFDVPTVVLRYFTVYGPRQRPDMAFHIFTHALLLNEPIEILGDGEQSREFTYAGDVVNANLLAAAQAAPGSTYNIGGGAEVSLNDTVRLLMELSGRSVPIRYGESKAGDARRTAADTRLARKELGYKPEIDLVQGLRQEIEWLDELLHERPDQESANAARLEPGPGKREFLPA